MASKTQIKKFIAMVAPIAQVKAQGRSEWSLPSVCIAQCCCESAYGTSKKMVNANAVLGIKVGKNKVHFGKAWKGKAYSTKTKECYDGKSYVNITDLFRAYDSIGDAIEDYYDMLATCNRYKKCLNESDPLKCITAIKDGGYATSPEYISIIMSIIRSNNLTKYDSVVTGKLEGKVNSYLGYDVGTNYVLQNNMYVREAAAGMKKKYVSLSVNAKSKGYPDNNGDGILKKGTVVTCKGVTKINNAIWMKIPSGWVCAVSTTGKIYVK